MGMIVAAIAIAGALAALTDWLFLTKLFGEARSQYPEVWWPAIRDGDTGPAKIGTVLFGFGASGGVVLLYAANGSQGLAHGITTGLLAFSGPAALLLTAYQFVKLDVWVAVALGLTWLTRCVLAGAVAGLIVP